ncbi:N-acetylneuraminate synthase family protein [Paenibacillus cymbidii]|uniref:N-acetylneuraminate synthase family protein n=1 Tax=Paenibacillus cymbidii TaxID=1639034 RepID=UPI0010811DCA|nr:N-acetylneuraminate synthase family protein [Paenibacillus cymbidii]
MDGLHSLIRRKSCLLVAEVAQAHDGSLGTAHAFIDAIADAGADAVKFQTHIAEEESTPDEPWRVAFSRQDKTRFEYWKRMEFSESQWAGLADHARERGLLFFSSPFSVAAVELLERLEVPCWKIASGEVANAPLIDRIAATGKPALLSAGLCTLEELDDCTGRLRRAGSEWLVLQCTTSYPCPPERIGLNLLSFYRDRYGCPVGLSDHSGTIFPGIAAAMLGAAMVEVHVTMSPRAFGPDVSSSLTFEQLGELKQGIDFVRRMAASPLDKEREAQLAAPLRELFGRSLVARRALAAGTVLDAGMIAAKKPGGGMPARQLERLVGMELLRPLAANERFSPRDVAPRPAAEGEPR